MRGTRRARRLKLLVISALVLALLAPAAAALADVPDDIMAQTAEIRGLTPRAPVPVVFEDPAKLRSTLLAAYESADAMREIEISRKLIVRLGLFSPDADLQGLFVDLYSQNVLGYYRPDDKRMYIVSGLTDYGPLEKITLAHEYTHALQDQYFDLRKLNTQAAGNGDRSLAIDALVEGDATISMLLWGRAHLTDAELAVVTSGGGDSSIDRAPPVVRDEVLFPYNDGALFVLQLLQSGGYEAVNAAFRKPPASTEQILHPEKYLAQDQPVEVTLPDLAAALGHGWSQLRSDVLGELDYRILLEQYVDPLAAARGSFGWGGDRFSLLQSDNGAIALALSSVWDTEADAQEFFSIYADTVRQRYGRRAVPSEEGPTRLSWSTPNGPLRLRQAGKQVWLVMADDEREASILMGALAGEAPTPVPTPGRAPAQVPAQLPR